MISCLFIGGLFFIGGYDINGNPYMVNIDMIAHVVEDVSVKDTANNFGSFRTMITTTNGTIVTNGDIMDVAIGIEDCERYYAIE
jgi:hypothetical protein